MDYVIIVAGGKGLRMGGDVPKQFLPIGGKPVLMRTMERFREAIPDIKIILVLPKAQQGYWASLCKAHGDFNTEYLLANGGETRFHSVQNGLALIPDGETGVVGVHDGVRPFVSVEVIRRCYETAHETKAVIPVMPVTDTLRSVTENRNVFRENYRVVQTPQVFDIALLKDANRQEFCEAFTDDASVVESFLRGSNKGSEKGVITMVEGNRENIKITTPFDLRIAEAVLSFKH